MKIFNFLQGIGALKQDTAEERAQKDFLVYLAVFMSIGGLVWGGLTQSYGLVTPSIFPLSYVVISFINILLFSQHKNFPIARIIQVFISLALPILFQYSLGGYGPSGGVALWSLLALIGSLSFRNRVESGVWLFLFLIGMLLLVYFDDAALAVKPEILAEFSSLFLVINIMLISTIVFGLTMYYTGEQYKAQVTTKMTLEKLKVNEEAMRKLAEKQLEDAEQLIYAQKELKKNNLVLRKSKINLQLLAKKQIAANKRLVMAQETLKVQEARFRKVVENAPLIILTINNEGVIDLADGSGLVKIGLEQSSLVGQKVTRFLGEDEVITESLLTVFEGETVVVNHEVKGRMFELHFIPIINEMGGSSALLVATDVEEQLKAKSQIEQALEKAKRSELSMRTVAEEQLVQSEKLMIAEKKLQKTLEEVQLSKKQLEDTQSQLVNNEKMASLGQLTAGIAHEINNPINFIYNGVDTLNLVISDIMPVIDQVKTLNGTNREKVMDEISNLKQEFDLDELTEDLNSLVDDIKKGAVRTMEIVRGLRVFSRLDEEEQKMANINENLDATLVLLRNKMKDKIELKKYYDESLGDVMCYPGQLNQVFMNIISNAIQAMPEETTNGQISIYTENKNSEVVVRIKDNGMGMNEEVKKRIFEPFYTTKPVGVGTGLGLSISFGIIEKHDGEIYVNSEVGKGTEFVITLPKEQK